MTAAAPLRVAHASGLRAVDRMLADLHRDVLRSSGGGDGGVVRMPVINIVAACVDVEAADLASQAVGRIGARHPARAIIVVAEPDADAAIEADIALQSSTTAHSAVYAEQVRLHVGGEAAYHLASVVTPLLVPDIPVHLWLIGTPPLRQAFGQDAVAICEMLIIDSGAYADPATTLTTLSGELSAAGDAIALCDLAWERVRLWRRLLAQSFDGERMRGFLRGTQRVDVECCGQDVSAQAWLLAGWLQSRLAAPGDGAPDVRISATHDGSSDRDVARCSLRCRSGDHEALVVVERRGDVLHTTIDVDGGLSAESAMPLDDVDTVDLVGQLLEGVGEDPVYRSALAAAAALASR